MAYENEFARGDSLWRLLGSPSVQEFRGIIRERENDKSLELPARLNLTRNKSTTKRVIAIDGSTTTHTVENGFPGAEAALFNLAVIVIKIAAMRNIPDDYIPGPQEIRDMEACRTMSAVLPGRNIVRDQEPDDSPKKFFRATLCKELEAKFDPNHETLLETLRTITKQHKGEIQCPADDCDNRVHPQEGISICHCNRKETIYETDVLRAHERFEDSGSGEQAFTAFRQAVEHLSLVNILRYFEKIDIWEVFHDTAFIMDGPLALFGMTAWLQAHVRKEITRLHAEAIKRGGPGILLMGVEKSGHFLEHLKRLDWVQGEGPGQRLSNRTALAPNCKYIHKYIVLRPLDAKPYGLQTYYGRHVLYKNRNGQHSVIMTPMVDKRSSDLNDVSIEAYPRIGEALDIMDDLSTYLYQDGFTPLVRAHAHAAIPLKAGGRIMEDLFQEG